MATGIFITFEGGEGAGKSTQIRRLAEKFALKGVECVLTREPGGTPRAEILRDYILNGRAKNFGARAEAILFTAARINHLDALIRPALLRGAAVLCDRFADSTRAYQGARGEVADAELLALQTIALDGVAPDLTFVLDLAPELGLERARKRRGLDAVDRFEAEDLSFHRALREKFLQICRQEPARCALIDASAAEDVVAEDVFRVISERYAEIFS